MLNGFKTHITALVGLIVAALVGLGVVTPEVQSELAEALVRLGELGIALVLAFQSVLAIFQRIGTAKVEKKADEAKATADSVASKLPLVLACVFVLPMMAGCTAGSKLGEIITNPDGKPVVTGTICVNTPNGRFCYVPETKTIVEPEPAPPAAAIVPAPVTPAVAPLAVAPHRPQLAK